MSTLNRIPLMSCMEFIHYYKLPYMIDAKNFEKLGKDSKWSVREEFYKRALETDTALIVTDLNENILWVNTFFQAMTGYDKDEVLGRKPNMLQGEKTNSNTKVKIRTHINESKPFKGVVHNYKKDGILYECQVHISPVFNTDNKLVNFVAFEKQIDH